MNRRHGAVLILTGALIGGVPSCVKPNTFNGANRPDQSEVDRLQQTIDARPNLAVATDQLTDLDRQIRSLIARYAPGITMGPSVPKSDRGCNDPFGFNAGDTYSVESIRALPGPSVEQWKQISAALQPILNDAGFKPNFPPGVQPDWTVVADISGEGSTINLHFVPPSSGNPATALLYDYSSGCRPRN